MVPVQPGLLDGSRVTDPIQFEALACGSFFINGSIVLFFRPKATTVQAPSPIADENQDILGRGVRYKTVQIEFHQDIGHRPGLSLDPIADPAVGVRFGRVMDIPIKTFWQGLQGGRGQVGVGIKKEIALVW